MDNTSRRSLPILGQETATAPSGGTDPETIFDGDGHLILLDTDPDSRAPDPLDMEEGTQLDTLPELAQVLEEEEERQELFRRAKPTGEGEDENGHYLVIPLSMHRGGKLNEFKVYTSPEKHLISEGSAAPRGWYKSKHEPPGVRPRPCYSEALLTTPYTGYCNVGCKFSMAGETPVATLSGLARLDSFSVGDIILGRFPEGMRGARVTGVTDHWVDSYYRAEFEDGTALVLTGDHPLFSLTRGWINAEDVEINEYLEGVQILREADSQVLADSLRRGGVPEACQTGRAQGFSWDSGKAVEESGSSFREPAEGHDRAHAEGRESLCQRPKAGGLEGRDARKASSRTLRVQGVPTQNRGGSGREHRSFPFRMGVSVSTVDDTSGLGLEARGDMVQPARHHGVVFPGLPGARWRADSQGGGGEGILLPTGPGAVPEVQVLSSDNGTIPGAMGWESPNGTEYTVAFPVCTRLRKLERIEGRLHVYDIQTESDNFVAGGVLVHNCYIDHGTRGYKATGLPVANPNYPEDMRVRLAKINVSGAVYMSSFTEVFQNIEERHSIVERLTDVVVEEGLPIFYLTRKIPPAWAIQALQQNQYSYMQFSINTADNNQYRRLSPGSYDISQILETIQQIHEAGIYVSIQCNPVLPGITSLDDILRLVELLSGAGTDHIIVKFCEQVTGNRKILLDRLRQSKLPGVDEFDKMLCQIIGGMYTIREDVRRSWLAQILAKTREEDMTMSLCYEYYDNGKAGSNMAPWFTTSDQCHGPAVPVHYRPGPGQKFRALEGCYRKGCLFCEEHGTKACGHPTLLAAPALTYELMRNTKLYETERPHTDADWDLPESCPRPEVARALRGRNPGLQTDAELWGLDELPPLTRRAVGLRGGSHAKEAISRTLFDLPAEEQLPESGGLG